MIWYIWFVSNWRSFCYYFQICGQIFSWKICVYIDLVWFYGISTIVGYLITNPFYICIYKICMIWFGWVLWHINHCRLFNAKSSLYKYIKYIVFGLVGFYGISTIVGYLITNPIYIYIYIYIYIWFGLVGFYGISTIVGYSMPNPLYTYILNLWFVNTFCW